MATVDRLNSALVSLAIKTPCRAGTTANIDLAGLQTIDGVDLDADDRVLVKDQTDGTENGIYRASTSTWQRSTDFNGNLNVVKGTMVRVTDGTANQDTYYAVSTNNPIIIGTSVISFTKVNNALLGVTAFTQGLLDDTSAAEARTTLGALQNVLTTTGDIVYQSSTGPARLPVGATDKILKITGGLPVWGDLTLPETSLTGGYIEGGLVTINGTDSAHDLDIAALGFRDSSDAQNFKTTTSFTKRLDATFAKGTGNGGMASGASLPASDYVYLFAVTENSSGDEDFMADTSITGANIIANETDWTIIEPPTSRKFLVHYRTDGSNNLLPCSRYPGGRGSLVLLEFLELSSGIVDYIFDCERYWDAFITFEMEFAAIQAANDGGSIRQRFSNDSGATFEAGATDYVTSYNGTRNNAARNLESNTTFYELFLQGTADAKEGGSGFIRYWNTEDFDQNTRAIGMFCLRSSAGATGDEVIQHSCMRDATEVTTNIQTYHSGGNLGGSGRITVWGKKKVE